MKFEKEQAMKKQLALILLATATFMGCEDNFTHRLSDEGWTFHNGRYQQVCQDCGEMQYKEVDSGVWVRGIQGYDERLFSSPREAYEAIQPFLEEHGGLGENALSPEAFKEVYSDVDGNGKATITWTIYGPQEIIEDDTHKTFMSFGRKSGRYGDDSHNCIFQFVGGNQSAKITTKGLSFPYQWWGTSTTGDTTKIEVGFTNLHIEHRGTDFFLSQAYNAGLIMTLKNCRFTGKLHAYDNCEYSITISDCTFDPLDCSQYALHIQGHKSESDINKSEPVTIKIEHSTFRHSRGINIDQATADALISKCTFSSCGNTTAEKNNNYWSTLQLTQGAKIVVDGNTFTDCKGNAIGLHTAGKVQKLQVTNNTISRCSYAFATPSYTDDSFLTSSGNKIIDTDTAHYFQKDGFKETESSITLK